MSKKDVQNDVRMVKFDMGEIVIKVEEYARARAKAQGWKYDPTSKEEVEFFTGALAMFFALDVKDLIPASWSLGPIMGKPVLLDVAKAQNE